MKTVSLELAKELKEAGYPQDTYFEWFDYHGDFTLESHVSNEFHGDDDKNYYAAPTADEIIEKLPIRVVPLTGNHERTNFYHDLQISRNLYWYEVDYMHEWRDIFEKGVFHKSFFKHGLKNKILANVCAEMWIFLKKEGYFDKNKDKAVWVDKSYDKKIKP